MPSSLAPDTRRRGPTAFGLALGLSTLVAVGGLAFALGRWSAEDPSSPIARSASGAGLASAGQAAALVDRLSGDSSGDGSRAALRAQLAAPAADADGQTTAEREDQAADTDDASGSGTPGGLGTRGFGTGGAFGGVEGTVTAIEDGTLSLTTEQAETIGYGLDADTQFLTATTIDAESIEPGELVRVTFPLPASGEGSSSESAEPADIASQVTVLAPGTELTQGFGAGGGGQGASSAGPGDAQGGAFSGRLGFDPFGVQGTVLGVADGGVMVTLPDGETQLIRVDSDTRFVRETEVDAAAVDVGGRVRVQTPRRGFGQAGTSEASDAQQLATTVTIIEPIGES